jgi:hypothetical protein
MLRGTGKENETESGEELLASFSLLELLEAYH